MDNFCLHVAVLKLSIIFVCIYQKKKKIVHLLKRTRTNRHFQGSKSTFKKDVSLLSTKKKKEKKVALAHHCH